MKRLSLVLLLAVAGLAMARDTVEDMVHFTSVDSSTATTTAPSEVAAPTFTAVILDRDYLETYATDLSYILIPRAAVALSGDWMEGDPYYFEDLFVGEPTGD